MGDKINTEFEKFQEDLKTREKKLKTIVHFEPDKEVDKILDEIKDKQLTL